ncbi:MAG: metal-dependent hydrolase [Bryobacteraceae bacterium]|nr:metal-dependent hydrolase [Bryobacteraceae bacterium]
MLEITWLGHGSFELRLDGGEVIVVDPWLGGPTYPKDHDFQRIDVILITHGHFDHMPDAVGLAKRFKPRVVCSFEIGVWLESKGVENVSSMNKGGAQKAGPVSVTMTHALHSSGILDDGKVIYGGEPCGYVIALPDGRSIYFAGDTDIFAEMEFIGQIHKPELAFLPIGDHYTMSPVAAALACRLLRPKKVIPMHFGTFPPLIGRPPELAELLQGTGVEVWPLEIGAPARW